MAGNVGCSSVLALCLVSLGAGCERARDTGPPLVEVAAALRREVPETFQWPARLEATKTAEVRPRVRGHLAAVHFAEGDRVDVGQLLFTIDDRPYRAALRAAEARVESAEGPEAAAGDAPDAALLRARLDLTWTRVTSPLEGFVAPPRHARGTGVGPETVLTTVSVLDPIVATFAVTEDEYRRVGAELERAGAEVALVIEDGRVHGRLARRVRPAGEGTLRAEFPNPGGSLRPGMAARVRLRSTKGEAALVIPLRALNASPGGPFVRVVTAGNVVETRRVAIGAVPGDVAVVTAGLRAGDQVVVGGAAALRDGATVTPRPAAGHVVPAGLGMH